MPGWRIIPRKETRRKRRQEDLRVRREARLESVALWEGIKLL